MTTTERNGSAEVCVGVLDGTLGRSFTFLFETFDGERVFFIAVAVEAIVFDFIDDSDLATMNVDYTSTTTNLTLTLTDTEECVVIDITADDLPEGREGFSVGISSPAERGVMLSPDQGTIIIEGSVCDHLQTQA